jgi:DeoR/GlpR family transcriptional regulator of sugar metabolism
VFCDAQKPGLDSVDQIITDKGIDEKLKEKFIEKGIDVKVV